MQITMYFKIAMVKVNTWVKKTELTLSLKVSANEYKRDLKSRYIEDNIKTKTALEESYVEEHWSTFEMLLEQNKKTFERIEAVSINNNLLRKNDSLRDCEQIIEGIEMIFFYFEGLQLQIFTVKRGNISKFNYVK